MLDPDTSPQHSPEQLFVSKFVGLPQCHGTAHVGLSRLPVVHAAVEERSQERPIRNVGGSWVLRQHWICLYIAVRFVYVHLSFCIVNRNQTYMNIRMDIKNIKAYSFVYLPLIIFLHLPYYS